MGPKECSSELAAAGSFDSRSLLRVIVARASTVEDISFPGDGLSSVPDQPSYVCGMQISKRNADCRPRQSSSGLDLPAAAEGTGSLSPDEAIINSSNSHRRGRGSMAGLCPRLEWRFGLGRSRLDLRSMPTANQKRQGCVLPHFHADVFLRLETLRVTARGLVSAYCGDPTVFQTLRL